jgi:hypothetical protein
MQVSIAAVAVRWVLQQPSVGGAILGMRLGHTGNSNSNPTLFREPLTLNLLSRLCFFSFTAHLRKSGYILEVI